MTVKVVVHPRVIERHPELAEADVLHAWKYAVQIVRRNEAGSEGDVFAGLGFDAKGRMLELCARRQMDGSMLIYHAMTPPSKKTLNELRMR